MGNYDCEHGRAYWQSCEICKPINFALNKIPQLSQRQDSTQDQIRDLWAVANRLGMYDAADLIKPMCGFDK